MFRITAAVLCVGLSAMASGQSFVQFIASDFEDGSDGWTVGGPDGMALAPATGGAVGQVLADTDIGLLTDAQSYNTTGIPLEVQVDLDYMITSNVTDPFVIGLHVAGEFDDPSAPIVGALTDHMGYYIVMTGGAPSQQSLKIQRRNAPGPAGMTVIAEIPWVIDTETPHHMRITDCGCGRLTLYIDDMVTPAIYVDDKYAYAGRNNAYLGFATPGLATGWIDNVLLMGEPIPEPATMLLLAAGVPVLVRRRLR